MHEGKVKLMAAGRVARSLCLLVMFGVSLHARAELLPVEHYTRAATLSGVSISPNGKRLAVLIFGQDGMRRAGVIDLDPLGRPRMVGGFDDADVVSVAWVNDDRLVFEAYERGAEIRSTGAGVFAVNHDGSDRRLLIAWSNESRRTTGTHIATRVLPSGWRVHSVPGKGDEIIVAKISRDGSGDFSDMSFERLNTLTGERKNLSVGMPTRIRDLHFDPTGAPRLAESYREGRGKLHWRKSDGSWVEAAEFDALREAIAPWYVGGDDDIKVLAQVGDTTGLFQFDLAAGKVRPEPVVQLKSFDLNAHVVIDTDTRRLVGMHFMADRPMSYWFDDKLDKVQKIIDAALPTGRINRLYCGACQSTRFFLVLSESDRHPGEYYFFDRETSALHRIGAMRPWIVEGVQGRRSFHRFDARDGLKVPVVVTHPAGASADKPLPTVVVVHGGPFVRGEGLGWDDEAQFLASRGYRVLQPAFRGSLGFGLRHFQAGWKEWGHGMVDDIADAVQWATKQGLTDASRVCVMGASYGGYAALMSVVAYPKLYRCAASFAGVVDPVMLYSVQWSDMSDEIRKYSMPLLLGDREKDADRLAAASPLKRVAEIKVPVLLAHGGVDRRVPVVHAHDFASAAEKAGVKLEKVIYPDEGHGFYMRSSESDYFRRLERFFKSALSPVD